MKLKNKTYLIVILSIFFIKSSFWLFIFPVFQTPGLILTYIIDVVCSLVQSGFIFLQKDLHFTLRCQFIPAKDFTWYYCRIKNHIEHVEEAFETLERGRLRIDALKELSEGELTISTSDTTAYYILPDVLQEFRDQYPGIDVRIHCRPSPVSAEQVLAHEADVGIVTLPIEHPKLASEPLIIREDVAICAPGHELTKRRIIAFRDLAEYPLLLLDRGSNTRAYIDHRLSEAGLTPKIAMELGSIEVIKKLVQLDFGVSIVPLIAIHDEVDQGTLKAIRIFRRAECRTLGIIHPAKGIFSIAAQIFVKMLKKRLSDKKRL